MTLALLAATTLLVAGHLAPGALRSLDALHLVTTLERLPDVQGVLTYDTRMTEGASAAGLAVVAPGR